MRNRTLKTLAGAIMLVTTFLSGALADPLSNPQPTAPPAGPATMGASACPAGTTPQIRTVICDLVIGDGEYELKGAPFFLDGTYEPTADGGCKITGNCDYSFICHGQVNSAVVPPPLAPKRCMGDPSLYLQGCETPQFPHTIAVPADVSVPMSFTSTAACPTEKNIHVGYCGEDVDEQQINLACLTALNNPPQTVANPQGTCCVQTPMPPM